MAYLHFSEYTIDDDNEVMEAHACPKCGERDMDKLANDDGIVTCQSCGTVYDLEPERREAGK